MPQDLGLAVSAAAVCLDTDPRGLGGASGTALAFDAMSGAARVVIEASSIGSSTPGGSASRGELQAHGGKPPALRRGALDKLSIRNRLEKGPLQPLPPHGLSRALWLR